MPFIWEERLLFIVVLFSVPALVYALEKLFRRKIYNRTVVIFLYMLVSLNYFDILEQYYRDTYDEFVENKKVMWKEELNIYNADKTLTEDPRQTIP